MAGGCRAAYAAAMKKRAIAVGVTLASLLCAQDPPTGTAAQFAARIRAGGWLQQLQWRRGDDGMLEVLLRDPAGVEPDGFVPLLGEQFAIGLDLRNCGLIGYLSLFCHGPHDLLAMTDAGFHFAALGIEPTDVGLRQLLAVPAPPFAGARGRAELLDRLLAIDTLVRRGCRSATAEFAMLADREQLPAPLRERARLGLAALRGETGALARRRLTAEALRLPAAFDGCVMIDHARLPDLGWLTALGRRLGALLTAQAIEHVGGQLSPATLAGAQRMCDVAGELPFGVAHRFGNARLDHSCVVISARAGSRLPVALTWQAAGEFEAEGWQQVELPEGAAEDNPLLGGTLAIAADQLFATTDRSKGMARPALVEKLGLLLDTGEAIRAIVPGNSKLWPVLAFLELPPAEGAELRVTFGEPATIVLAVTTRDEETAEAWVTKGRELLARARKDAADGGIPRWLREEEHVAGLLDSVFGASLCTKGDAAFATVELRGMTSAKVRAIAEGWELR